MHKVYVSSVTLYSIWHLWSNLVTPSKLGTAEMTIIRFCPKTTKNQIPQVNMWHKTEQCIFSLNRLPWCSECVMYHWVLVLVFNTFWGILRCFRSGNLSSKNTWTRPRITFNTFTIYLYYFFVVQLTLNYKFKSHLNWPNLDSGTTSLTILRKM